MRVTIETIAQNCNVSPATVSRVLANKNNVSKKTRDAVLGKMRELNYAPEKITRIADLSENKIVLILVEDVSRISNMEIYRAAREYLASLGFVLLLNECTRENRNESIRLAKSAFSGCIVIAGEYGSRTLTEFENTEYPLVAVHWCNDWASIDSVIEDTYKCAMMAVKHLVSLGHKHIVLIKAPEMATGGKESVQGFKKGMEQSGLTFSERQLFSSDLTSESGADAVKRILCEMPETTGIVCANHDTAGGAIRQLCGLGKRVPEDYSVIAHGLRSHTFSLLQEIASVGCSNTEIGEMAARCVIEKINASGAEQAQPSYTKKLILEPRLKEGTTVDKPREAQIV